MGGNQRFQRKPHISIIFASEATSRIIPITNKQIPSQKPTKHIPSKGSWEDEFPFPSAGYVTVVPRRVVHCEPNLKCWLPVFI